MRTFLTRPICAVAAVAFAVMALPQAHAEPLSVQSISPPRVDIVSSTAARAEVQARLAEPRQAVTENALVGNAPTARATVELSPMFSAQGGSWPFEPFVNAGLFKEIAGYQAHHPQVLSIEHGTISLSQLHAAVANERVLRKHKDGYLLSYPVMIGKDAALIIKDTTLYLYAHSGAAIINQGHLQLSDAQLESWSGEQAGGKRAYRPFLMAWAGSSTIIERSSLRRLGYNSHLSRGLTTARSSQQAASVPAAKLLIRDSHFSEMAAGAELQDSLALIENSSFKKLQQYGLDLNDSQVSVIGNQIDGVDNHSGIRLRGNARGELRSNLVQHTGKAAIELSAVRGAVLVSNNTLDAAGTNAIQVRDLTAGSATVLSNNLITGAAQSGIDADGFNTLQIIGNRITASTDYALYLRNPLARAGKVTVLDNAFAQIGRSMIKTESVSQLTLGANHYDTNALQQEVLSGDLLPIQSQIMDATVKRPCFVEVRTGAAAAHNNPATRAACN